MTSSSTELTLDDLLTIDSLCDRYEAGVRCGKGLQIEELLADVPPRLQSAARTELLSVELEIARHRGVPVSMDELRQRFPTDEIERVLEAEVLQAETVEQLHGDQSSIRPISDASSNGTDERFLGDRSKPGRYRVLRLHAQGGLGRIWLATDCELNREVALKEMHIERARYAESRSRFLLEAEITGQLEHPGIVPVYGKGISADGRPFYAMRFIQGESFDDAIRNLHQPSRGSPYAPDRAFELRKHLGNFVALCNIIEFAHSRGVIHRDIKPANVMLGAFGETLVVDWGLAKRYRNPANGEASGSTPNVGTAENSATSQDIISGTPQYMSPEQANGEDSTIGPLSDIYSLGVTLYQLLVGQPAFPGSASSRVLDAVVRGQFVAPRKRNPKIPPALNAICLRAMSLRPEQRYQSARLLADDIERWLANEPVLAYPDSLWIKWSRYAQRHRAWVRSGVAALLVVAAASGLAAWKVGVERRRAAASDELAAAARERESRERLATQTTTSVLASLFESLDPLGVTSLGFGESNRDKSLDASRSFLDRGRKLVLSELSNEPLHQSKLLNALGLAYLGLGDLELAESLLDQSWQIRQVQIQQGVLDKQHPDVLAGLWSNAIVKHLRSEMDQAETLFRRVLEAQKQTQDCPPLAIARTQFHLAFALHEVYRSAEAEPLLREALETRQKILGNSHLEVAWTRLLLIATLVAQGKNIELLQEAAKLGQFDNNDASAAIIQGFLKYQESKVLRRAGKYEEALAAFRPLVDDSQRVFGNQHPISILAQYEYAGILSQAGDVREAEQVALRTLNHLPPIIASNPRIAEIHVKLGRLLAQRGDSASAEKHFREAMRIGSRAQVKEHLWGFEAALELANWKGLWGDPISAERLCRDAFQTAKDPTREDAAERTLIGALLGQGKFDEANEIIQRFYEREWKVRGDDLGNEIFIAGLCGRNLRELGDFAAARSIEADALKVVHNVIPDWSAGRDFHLHQGFAAFLTEQRDLVNADRMWRMSWKGARQNFPSTHPDLASILLPIARFFLEEGSASDARSVLTEILQIQFEKLGPEHLAATDTQLLLASAEQKVGESASAIARARNAREVRWKQFGGQSLECMDANIQLARILRDRREFKEAERLLREAVAELEKLLLVTAERLWRAYLELADLLLERQHHRAAAECLEAAKIRMSSAYPRRSWRIAELSSRLGAAYAELDRHAESQELLRSSLDILTEAFGANHPRTIQAKSRLGRLAQKQSHP